MGQVASLYPDSASGQLLEPWMRQHLPSVEETVLRRLIQLTSGIFEEHSALVERIADGSLFTGTTESNATQVRRILRDHRINLDDVYYPMIKSLLAETTTDTIYVSMDESSHTGQFNIFQVGIVTDALLLPIGFLLYATDDPWADDGRDLLGTIATLMPPSTNVIVLADRIHTGEPFITCVRDLGWEYIFRAARDTLLETPTGWKEVRQMHPRRDPQRFLTNIRIWKGATITANVSIYRYARPGFKTVMWYIVSSLPPRMERFKEYACRWWQECGFKLKKSGLFDWERSRVTDFQRVEVLLIGMYSAIWALWIVGRQHERRPQHKATTTRPQPRRKNMLKQGIAIFTVAKKRKRILVLEQRPEFRVLDYERMFAIA